MPKEVSHQIDEVKSKMQSLEKEMNVLKNKLDKLENEDEKKGRIFFVSYSVKVPVYIEDGLIADDIEDGDFDAVLNSIAEDHLIDVIKENEYEMEYYDLVDENYIKSYAQEDCKYITPFNQATTPQMTIEQLMDLK
jgi:hypothetical protein